MTIIIKKQFMLKKIAEVRGVEKFQNDSISLTNYAGPKYQFLGCLTTEAKKTRQ